MDRRNGSVGTQIIVKPDNTITVEDFEIRQPGRGEVLIETVSTLISAGTELGTQEQPRTNGFAPGYSNAGKIIAIGSDINDYAVGDRVLSLGRHATHVTTSATAQSLAIIPDDLTFDQGAYGVLGSVSLHGVRRAKVELGEFVAITGMGIVGQLALQLVSQTGCEILIALDLSNQRLRVAKDSGATHALNPQHVDVYSEINRITGGRGIDLVIEASGYPELLPVAFQLARIGGRIMLLGSIWHRKIEVDFMDFHEKELTLVGCHQPKCPTTSTHHFPWTQQYNRQQILKMILHDQLDVDVLTTHRVPYHQIAEAYRLLRDERDKSLGILLSWN